MGQMQHQPSSIEAETIRMASTQFALLLVVLVGVPLAVNLAVLLSTGTFNRFLGLFRLALPLLIFAWPISLPLAIWICISHSSWGINLKKHDVLWLAPLIVIPISMLVWGAVFANQRGHGFARWQLTALEFAFYSTVLLGVLAVAFNRGRRSMVGAYSVLLILFSFSCAFTAGSSVTGDWL
jgi:hypothetical protein